MSTEMIAGALFSILLAVLGFLGAKVIEKLDDGVKMLHQVHEQLRADIWNVSSEAHSRINKLDNRVTVIETKCGVQHNIIHAHSRRTDLQPEIDDERLR
jgi:hypothetical protein